MSLRAAALGFRRRSNLLFNRNIPQNRRLLRREEQNPSSQRHLYGREN
jgi:hypothetical protein